MTNSTPIKSNILSSSFCLTNASANNVFWIYFGIFVPVSLLIMFVSMKYACKLKMLSFCSILSLLIETVTISSVLGGITYSFVLWVHTSKFVDYDCSFYEFGFPGSSLFHAILNEDFLLDINILYIAGIIVGFIIFTGILIKKLKLMKIAQEMDEEFEEQYQQEGYSCEQQRCRWLAAKIKYQWTKFWRADNIIMLLIKIFLFITGFSLCASLQPLYSIGNAYDEDYSKISNNCLCIENSIGTAMTLYGGAITAMIAFAILCFISISIFNGSSKDEGKNDDNCIVTGCRRLIGLAFLIAAFILGLFVIASPFLMIYTRFGDIYESIRIPIETGTRLRLSDVITGIFFSEMLIHAFNDCGCRC